MFARYNECGGGARDIGFSRRPGTDADSYRRRSSPFRSAAPAFAARLNLFQRPRRQRRRLAGDKHLIEDDIVQNAEAPRVKLSGELPRALAELSHQLVDAGLRPSDFSAAQSSMPRARRDISGVYSIPSRPSPGWI